MPADYTFLAVHPYSVDYRDPVTHVNELEDGSELRQEVDPTTGATFRVLMILTAAQLVDLMGHWRTVRNATSFQAATSDPNQTGFDAANPATTPLGTVRYASMPSWTWRGPDEYEARVDLVRLPNE